MPAQCASAQPLHTRQALGTRRLQGHLPALFRGCLCTAAAAASSPACKAEAGAVADIFERTLATAQPGRDET